VPIIIYVAGIIVVAIAVSAFFFLNAKKDAKRIEKLRQERQEAQTQVQLQEQTKEIEKTAVVEPVKDAEFEDFSLDGEVKDSRNTGISFTDEEIDAMFSTDDEYERHLSEMDDFETDEELDRKFAEYEQFLRDNLDFEDEQGDASDFISFSDYNAKSMTSKTNNEVETFLKNLSPQAREFMMAEVFSRKNVDSEED